MIYTSQQKELLRCTSMEAVLAAEGYNVDHTANHLYFSPFREERTPSFEINDTKHLWHDWGRPESKAPGFRNSGDTITLVQELKGYSYGEALNYLANFNPNISYTFNVIKTDNSSSKVSNTRREILSCNQGVTSDSLIRYMTLKRHISDDIFNRYCDEVRYCIHCTKDDGTELQYQHSAIGFRHIDGTYTLRCPPTKTYTGKSSTGANFTFIAPDGSRPTVEDGNVAGIAQSKTVVVFEGFINFLSFLQLNDRPTPATVDVVVLNSVSNLDKALPLILNHDNVVTYLDNDIKSQTGQLNTLKIAQACQDKGIRFFDNAKVYATHNDLNDFLVARDRERAAQMAEEKTNQQNINIENKENIELTQENESRSQGFRLH